MADKQLQTAFAMQNKINILSTAEIEQSLIVKAAAKNIFIETIPFIKIKLIEDESLRDQIIQFSKQKLTVVFTSNNAVKAVTKYLNPIKPNWKIFCIGATTKKNVGEYFGGNKIIANADTASLLAVEIILQKNISSVIFFCGDKKRDELPEKLKQKNIEVNEVEVYQTVQTSQALDKVYNAILFYSPSAVESFFSNNKIKTETILFAIGNTTAYEIKKLTTSKIVVADKPSKEFLLQKVINFFETILLQS